MYKVDCDNRKLGLIQVAVYDKKAEIVNSTKLQDYEVEIDYVIPDSVGESYLDTYCNLPLISEVKSYQAIEKNLIKQLSKYFKHSANLVLLII